MNNIDKFLPVGTVVLLNGGKKRIMITGYIATSKDTKDKIYDYIGCLYPEGMISSNKNLLFDHSQIDKIFYMGYKDDEQKQFSLKLNQIVNNVLNNNIQDKTVKDNNINEEETSSSLSEITFDDSFSESNTKENNENLNDIFTSIPSSNNN